MKWGCAEIIHGGQKDLQVLGPLQGWEDKVKADADLYWAPVRKQMEA